MLKSSLRLMVILLISWLGTAAGATESPPLKLDVDLSEAPHRILHGQLVIPVSPGPLTLLYPKWIPGEHGPTGPITDFAGLKMSAGAKPVAWERDPLDMYTFHVEIPEGADLLEVHFDFLIPSDTGLFTNGPSASDQLAVLSWNTVLLYPAGRDSDDLLYQARLRLPPGWSFGTALPVAQRQGDVVDFQPVSLTTLVDSPVAAGAHYRRLDLMEEDGVPYRLHVVADSTAALEMTPEAEKQFRQLAAEGLGLFGAHHFDRYDFLLTLSDHVSSFGLEHHQSSDNRLPEESLIDKNHFIRSAGLLPHEFVHSWNAKYRRPDGLARADYQAPFVDDLLWVYEGLTSYLGEVLTARSGLWTPEMTREDMALMAAGLEQPYRPGREWRPLEDTTRAAQILYGSPIGWSSWRRGVDFYDEGVLIWLEVDALIRQATGDARSLDDFCRSFFGPPSGPAEVRPYTYDDLVAALNAVAPHDWDGFFRTRVKAVAPTAPVDGLALSGWKLEYTEQMNAYLKASEESNDQTDVRFSLGLTIYHKDRSARNGLVLDSIPGMPAAKAGIVPGMKLVAVNGRRWDPDGLRRAIRDAKERSEPIELLIENADFYRTHAVHYHGGERYPHLVRDDAVADRLTEILRSRAKTGSSGGRP